METDDLLNRLSKNIEDSYDVAEGMSGDIPQDKTTQNLSQTISTVEGDSGNSKVTVNPLPNNMNSCTINGQTVYSAGGVITVPTDEYCVVTGNCATGYVLGGVAIPSGDGSYYTESTDGSSGIVITATQTRISMSVTTVPSITLVFDSHVSSVTIDGIAYSQSGAVVSFRPSTTHTFSVEYESGYMSDSITITGDATISSGVLTVGSQDSTINITSQAVTAVNVTFTFTNVTSVGVNGQTISTSGDSVPLTGGQTYLVTVTASNNLENVVVNSGTGYVISDLDTAAKTFNLTVGTDDGEIAITAQCIAAGTLITLADGTKKKVEDLSGNEELLVWDFDTASYSSAPIVFVEPEEEKEYEVIRLIFENETFIEIYYEHGFFDCEAGKFVYITSHNADDYIGHRFFKQDGESYSAVMLTQVERINKRTTLYGLTTYKHFNFFNNDLMSIEGNITGMFNYFDVDTKTMGYDQKKKKADIKKYGLLSYEDFEGIIDKVGFDAYNGQYLAVSIGKGLITWDGIKALAAQYGHFTEGLE